MKKILSIASLALLTLSMSAQEKMPSIYPADHAERITEMLQSVGHARRMPSERMLSEMQDQEQEQTIEAAPERIASATTPTAGYLQPEGTFFTGVKPNGSACTPGVIGAWAFDLDCWTWRNRMTGYKTIEYKTQFSYLYPQYTKKSNYFVDPEGNFCDTIVAKGGYDYRMDLDGEDGFPWQNATPVQTVMYADSSTESFALFQSTFNTNPRNCALAVGGLPSKASDGLWPLTYAVQGNTPLIKQNNEYIYGTSSPSQSMLYGTFHGFGVQYEKPQRELYIQSISISLSADGFNQFESGKKKLHYSPLTAYVLDHDGNVIAQTDSVSKLYASAPKFNQMVTFHFAETSEYGEVLNQGFTVNEAFRVEIRGFQLGDTAACYYTPDNLALHADSSFTIYKDNSGQTKYVYQQKKQPYIMLHGIMPTLEEYYTTNGNEEIGIHGDTIDVSFHIADGLQYRYVCGFANTTYQGQQQFAFYSTFRPYDQQTRYWTMDIERPDYILMSADYEYVLEEDEFDPENNVTLWSYYRIFTLYAYATERPVVGDTFSIGRAGRKFVFLIKDVDGDTTPGKLPNSLDEYMSKSSLAQKLMRDGQVVIRRAGKLYNMQGMCIR